MFWRGAVSYTHLLGARGGAQARGKSTVMDRLPENVRQSLERMRRGERTEESKQ